LGIGLDIKTKIKCLWMKLKEKINYENDKKEEANNNKKNKDQVLYKNQIKLNVERWNWRKKINKK